MRFLQLYSWVSASLAAADYMLRGQEGGTLDGGLVGGRLRELGDLPAWTLPLPHQGWKGPKET